MTRIVLHDRRVGRVRAQRDGDDRTSNDGGDARTESCGEEEGVEGVVCQGAGHAARTAEEEVLLVRGPELGGGVVEAEGEGLVPRHDVAVREVFQRGGSGVAVQVGEGGDVVGVRDELGEVFLRQVGDEIGVQDDGGAVAVQVRGVGGVVCVLDDDGAGRGEGFECRVEGREDGGGGVGHGYGVAGDSEADAGEGGEVAGCDVVWEGVAEGTGGCVVVVRIWACDCLEEVGGVFDRSGHRADGVLVFGDGDDKCAGRESNGGLDTDEVVDVAGTEDTAARFCS